MAKPEKYDIISLQCSKKRKNVRRCSAPPFLYFGGRIIREKILIKTERLVLRELGDGDFDVLYAVLADSDIMRHYPYTFDEKRVRGA